MEYLEPMNVIKYPTKMFPDTEPSDEDAPIHEMPSTESGPVVSGVCSD